MRNKVTVVGAGNVGASCAVRLADRGLADIVLVDVLEGIPQGKGLDILEAVSVSGFDVNLFAGVPVKLGVRGVEKIFEAKLTESELAALHRSAAAVKELVDVMAPKLAEARASAVKD